MSKEFELKKKAYSVLRKEYYQIPTSKKYSEEREQLEEILTELYQDLQKIGDANDDTR